MTNEPPVLKKEAVYHLSSKREPSIRGRLMIISGNRVSLGFQLEHPTGSRVSGGLLVGQVLALIWQDSGYRDVFTDEPWHIGSEVVIPPDEHLPQKQ